MSAPTVSELPGLAEAKAINPGAVVVHFSQELTHQVEAIAKDRATRALGKANAHGAGPKNGVPNLRADLLGVAGEMALAKYLGIFFDPPKEKRGPDVRSVCVRCRSMHDWDLYFRPSDAGEIDLPWVLVTHIPGQRFALLHGWRYGREIVQLGKWTDYGNAREKVYWLGQDKLRPMQTLTQDIWDQLPF